MRFNTHALEKLANYSWRNVRELQHSIEKAVIMSDSAVLLPADLNSAWRPGVFIARLTLKKWKSR
jgi:DNA-binding NtrC family response regulator